MITDDATVRIRGVFATALTSFLLEKNFVIVQPSDIVAERVGIDKKELPARVTIKSQDDDPSKILIIGRDPYFNMVLEQLRSLFSFSFFYKSLLQQYSTVIAVVRERINEKCLADIGGIEILFNTHHCVPGRKATISITKPPIYPWEKAYGVEGFSLLTDNIVLTSYKQAIISGHIKDRERIKELEELSFLAIKENFGIRWRSNAGVTPIEKLKSELMMLINEAKKLNDKDLDTMGTIISKGQYIGIINTSEPDKRQTDSIREKTCATIPHHHTLKTSGETNSSIVDYAELLVEKKMQPSLLGETAMEYAWKSLLGKKIFFYHNTPEGRKLRLGPFKMIGFDKDKKTGLFKRKIHVPGVYDGLGTKKEPGDTIITIVPIDKWYLMHIYQDKQEKTKGVYININTPPEPGENYIRYLDLHLDIVIRPNEPPDIIDREKLEKAFSQTIIGKKLYMKTLEVSEKIISKLKNKSLEDPETIISIINQ